jgi:hypothetical protein
MCLDVFYYAMKRDPFRSLSTVLSKYDPEKNINKIYKTYAYTCTRSGCVYRVISGGLIFITYVFTKYQQLHYSDNLLIHSTAPTCFDVCKSSSGSFFVCPAELR